MEEVGSTARFVLARGFERLGDHEALLGSGGSRRLLAELTADPDRPEVRPAEAYRTLLAALQPGWTVRLLQIFWPDARPRLAFQEQVESWGGAGVREEGQELLSQGLLIHLQEAPLPFVRRTILEFALPGEAGLAWWEGLPGLLAAYGLRVRQLSKGEVEALAQWIFNPELEQVPGNGWAHEPVPDGRERQAAGHSRVGLTGFEADARANGYIAAVAPQAVEVGEARLLFPGGAMLPFSVRGRGLPGMPERPWARLKAVDFLVGAPLVYSLSLRREAPDLLKGSLRARRTLFEGLLLALAEKTGRRPSLAEQAADAALDAAESAVTLGTPAFRAALVAALYASRERAGEAETARRTLETSLRARGFIPQRLYYIAERALQNLQPGGELFPGLDEPVLLLEEALPLIPKPARQVLPPARAVLIGAHRQEGRDVFFSFKEGLDPEAPPPPHALTLILGEMGSGKTSLMRLILLQRLLQGRTAVSLDPEGENNRLCAALGGRVVPAGVPDDPETCLVHPLQGENPAEMLLAARFLITALSGEAALSAGAQAALHAAVKRRWERRPGPLSLADLVDALAAVGGPEAAAPMALLTPYARGGLWDGFFDRPQALLSTEIPPGAWWNFDLSGLREENKALVHAVLAWFLYHVVTVGERPLDVYIDEGWRLLRGGAFTDLLDELGRRARKRGVGVTLSTHLPGDLVQRSTSLSLASTAFIGRLGPEEAYSFFRSLGAAEGEARNRAEQVARLPPRVFLAAPAGGRGAAFPVQVTIPASWLALWEQLGAAR